MRSTTAKSNSGIAIALANLVLVCIALLLMAWPANASPNFDRSISLSSKQWLLVDQMTRTAMLATLGINPERGVYAIEETRDLFSRTLRGLRSGDAELGLVAATDPEVLTQIARIEAAWPRYDATLRTIITELRTMPEVDGSHILALTEIHTLMIEAVDNATDALRNHTPAASPGRIGMSDQAAGRMLAQSDPALQRANGLRSAN